MLDNLINEVMVFRKDEMMVEMKELVDSQLQETRKIEGRLAEEVGNMEQKVVKGVSRMVAKLNEGEVGSCDWCEEVECNGYPECEFQKKQKVKECIICGIRTHPWRKCVSKALR